MKQGVPGNAPGKGHTGGGGGGELGRAGMSDSLIFGQFSIRWGTPCFSAISNALSINGCSSFGPLPTMGAKCVVIKTIIIRFCSSVNGGVVKPPGCGVGMRNLGSG